MKGEKFSYPRWDVQPSAAEMTALWRKLPPPSQDVAWGPLEREKSSGRVLEEDEKEKIVL